MLRPNRLSPHERPKLSGTSLLATVKTLRDRQIDLLSLEEKIDTSSAAGDLVFHVFGAIAHTSSDG